MRLAVLDPATCCCPSPPACPRARPSDPAADPCDPCVRRARLGGDHAGPAGYHGGPAAEDRKSTRLNSSHSQISYAVFCLKKKKKTSKVHMHHYSTV